MNKGAMDSRTVFARDERVVARRIAGEILLVPVEGELANLQRVFALDGVGQFIWEKIDGARSIGALCDAVEREFEVGSEEAKRDCLAFVSELAKAKLVRETT